MITLTKDFAEHALNEKRYWTSRGVVVPEVMPIDHILSDDPVEALKLAFNAALRVGATLDRCQAFWRQELGVFWFATRVLELGNICSEGLITKEYSDPAKNCRAVKIQLRMYFGS